MCPVSSAPVGVSRYARLVGVALQPPRRGTIYVTSAPCSLFRARASTARCFPRGGMIPPPGGGDVVPLGSPTKVGAPLLLLPVEKTRPMWFPPALAGYKAALSSPKISRGRSPQRSAPLSRDVSPQGGAYSPALCGKIFARQSVFLGVCRARLFFGPPPESFCVGV